MDDNQRLHLQKMIAANNVEDNTELIRQLKHSHVLREDVNNLIMLKSKYPDDADTLHLEGMVLCNFLFTYYTDIYNKVRKDEIDINILHQFLDVLQKIEDGHLDQHTGSFQVGTLLKKLYVDSALKKAEKLDEENKANKEEPVKPIVDINWRQFKRINK
jgi:hypothetical protein